MRLVTVPIAVAAIVVFAFAGNAGATLITLGFDDLGPGRADIPAGYGGLDWSAGDWEYTDEYPGVYTRSSPPTAVFCNAGTPSISFGEVVRFKGVWVAADNRVFNYPATFILEGFLNGNYVGSSPLICSGPGQSMLIEVDWTVDSIREHATYYEPGSPGMWFFMLDDLRFDPVPEPATLTLLALAGLAMIRRNRSA